MTIKDDNLAMVEEVYRTQKQVDRWLGSDTPRADCFKNGKGLVSLVNLKPHDEQFTDSPPRNEMRALIERAFGPSKLSGNHEALRKIERPRDAVWTMFRHSVLVIGVHDDGTVVARDLTSPFPDEFRITTGGDFLCYGRVQEDADLKRLDVVFRFATMRAGLRLWVKHAKGRKVPHGLRTLERRVEKAGEVNLLCRSQSTERCPVEVQS